MPQVEQYTRLKWHGSLHIRKGNENLSEGRVAFADSTLFDVFTLPVINGNPKNALKEYHSLVITETIAKKYFNNTDVVGKTMLINDTGNYKITAGDRAGSINCWLTKPCIRSLQKYLWMLKMKC